MQALMGHGTKEEMVNPTTVYLVMQVYLARIQRSAYLLMSNAKDAVFAQQLQ